jgi:hypothetical protein
MRGNFEEELGRKESNTVVDARGWIFWQEIPSNVQTVRVAATIAQNEGAPGERCGTGWSAPLSRPNGTQPQEWRCDVPEDDHREFGSGAAIAGGALVSSNPAWVWPWGDDPTID